MSRATDNAVGMMDKAYFVGRQELLTFFNELLELNLAKIEQTATGAVACQITDYIFPGSIPMSRVNWEARSDYEFVANYKLLQNAFTKNNVKRYVDVPKLIRAKYQDNLEFCQWLKAFFDQSGAYREDYDPTAVRAKGKGGKKYNDTMGKGSAKGGYSRPKPRTTTRPTRPTVQKKVPLRASDNLSRPVRSNNVSKASTTAKASAVDTQLKKKNAELESKVSELEGAIGDIESERDFYFGKLRSIELFLQVKQDQNWEGCEREDVVENLFKVLYATVDNDVVVDDDGNIVPADPEASHVVEEGVEQEYDDILEEEPSEDLLTEEVALVETEY